MNRGNVLTPTLLKPALCCFLRLQHFERQRLHCFRGIWMSVTWDTFMSNRSKTGHLFISPSKPKGCFTEGQMSVTLGAKALLWASIRGRQWIYVCMRFICISVYKDIYKNQGGWIESISNSVRGVSSSIDLKSSGWCPERSTEVKLFYSPSPSVPVVSRQTRMFLWTLRECDCLCLAVKVCVWLSGAAGDDAVAVWPQRVMCLWMDSESSGTLSPSHTSTAKARRNVENLWLWRLPNTLESLLCIFYWCHFQTIAALQDSRVKSFKVFGYLYE